MMLTILRHVCDDVVRAPATGCLHETFPSFSSSCRVATGRSAIRHLIDVVRPPQALMPSYVAEGVLQPFLAAKVSVIFYRLNEDLTPDIGDLRAQLARSASRAMVVLIHYFGYPCPVEPVRREVDSRDGLLLEDCALALGGSTEENKPLGESADFVLYSLNKFLPVTDGAILLSRREEFDVSLDEGQLAPLPRKVRVAYKRHLALNAELARCVQAGRAVALVTESGEAYEEFYTVISKDLQPHAQSTNSRRIESATDYVEMRRRRRANAAVAHHGLADIPLVRLLHADLPPGAMPFAFPIRVAKQSRHSILKSLVTSGVMPSTLIDKWNFLPLDKTRVYANEQAFIDEHLLLPIAEDISTSQIAAMVDHLRALM
jgi:perosamine synthetase